MIAALRRGDERAAAEFFDRHAAAIEKLLSRILGPDADLGELVSDVFCRAFDRLDDLVDPSGARAWLRAIATNVAREQLRRRKRRAWLSFRAHDELPEVPVEPPNDAREAVRRLFVVLDTLPEDERTAFALRSFEDCAHGEIAAILGISLATVKRKIARAEERIVEFARGDAALATFVRPASEDER